MKNPTFPMRINQYLAWKRYSTRRGGDELIQRNKVLINGKPAKLGDRVSETDVVEVLAKVKKNAYKYFAYNKPKGEITNSPALLGKDVFPLGRLDKESRGLIILTNDGRATDRLLNPEYDHEKEYLVTVSNKLRSNFKEKMESGINLEGNITKPCKVSIAGEHNFRITLTEGKKHQIRRMCVALHNQVTELKRIRVMNIKLGDLNGGRFRAIEGEELDTFLKSIGL